MKTITLFIIFFLSLISCNKSSLLDSAGDDRFVGAYRYDGYSLFDILDKRIFKKANSAEFKPIIDLYVEIEYIRLLINKIYKP